MLASWKQKYLRIWNAAYFYANLKRWFLYLTTAIFKQTVSWRNFMIFRGGSRAAATSKMERFVIIVNGLANSYHKALHLGCCSSPRSASDIRANWNMEEIATLFNQVFMFRFYVSHSSLNKPFQLIISIAWEQMTNLDNVKRQRQVLSVYETFKIILDFT